MLFCLRSSVPVYDKTKLFSFSSSLRPGFYVGSRPPIESNLQSKSGNMAADLRLERSRFRGS